MATDEVRWVAEARRGDRNAFRHLVEAYSRALFALCMRITRDSTMAEDAVQEAFFNAYRHLGDFDGRSSFKTWLHRIAVNAVLARGRRRHEDLGGDESIEDQIASSIADTGVEDAGESRDLENAIGLLPPGARHVLVLAGVYGYSHEETASMLGIAVGTCKAQLHRARHLLSRRLGLEEARA